MTEPKPTVNWQVNDRVVAHTDTGYQDDGIPVSLNPGSVGIVLIIDPEFTQVWISTHVGKTNIGIPHDKLTKFEQ